MSTETEEKTDAPAKQAPGVDELVTKFIELRDKKSKLKREYETKVEAVDALLERLERHFMGVLDGMVDNVSESLVNAREGFFGGFLNIFRF